MKVVNQQVYQNYHNNNLKSQNVRNNRAGAMQNTMASDTVSFNGLFNARSLRKMDGWAVDLINYAPGILNRSERTVGRALKGKSTMQKRLFAELTESYNRRNFALPNDKRENADMVFDIVDKIKKPSEQHLRLVSSPKMEVTDAAKCFDRIGDSPKKVAQFNEVFHDLINAPVDHNISKESILGILDSEHSGKILKDYKSYRPYLRMHLSEKDCIKNLDKQISNGTYDSKLQQNIYDIKNISRGGYGMEKAIDAEKMAPHASPESNSILEMFIERMEPSRVEDKSNYKKNMVEIYSTTNKKNYEARSKYMDSYMQGYRADHYKPDEMDNITALFRKMDEDKSVKKFIEEVSVPKSNTVGAGEYIRLADGIDSKRRGMYGKNIAYIMSQGLDKPVDTAIRFAKMNPGTTEGKAVKSFKSFVSGLFKTEDKHVSNIKARRRTTRSYNKSLIIPKSETLAAKQAAKTEAVVTPVVTNAKPAVTPNLPAVRYNNPNFDLTRPRYNSNGLPKMEDIVGEKNRFKFVISKPVEQESKPLAARVKVDAAALPAQIYSFPALNNLEKAVKASSVETAKVVEPAKDETKVLRRGIFTNKVAKQPSAKKLAVISDVNGIIEKKLGKNTYADQSRVYANKATKMRAGMLPEIFASIKETRAQKRATGTFSRTKTESNADALELFQKIKGNNKRLVNYMLKVRNQDGTRMYTVRDIVGKINETESTIRAAKKSAPKDAPFMAKDAKAMYDGILNDQIAQHGKLPRAKKA